MEAGVPNENCIYAETSCKNSNIESLGTKL